MSSPYPIQPDARLSLQEIGAILSNGQRLQLAEASRHAISNCRSYLERKLAEPNAIHYGINTGFGSLCNIRISAEETESLQHNLVMSHACGMGEEVPQEVVRIMLLLKVKSLSKGYSGVRLVLVERLVDFYNEGLLPVIYEQGSLGASGDLAPLAHLSLPLLGLGEVYFKGERMDAKTALDKLGLGPMGLASKEGLALLNGTQFSTAYGLWSVLEAQRLYSLANMAAALSIDAFDCGGSPFLRQLHEIRPHAGQQHAAEAVRNWLEGSPIQLQPKHHVQDPYAFRCVPQVHGASYDALNYVGSVIETEANAVTDNPNIFPEDDLILSGGNFHAQPIALALDFLAIALSEIGSISERRTYQLISGSRSLPAFLTPKAGLHSGLMIPQYTAASIASQNKQLCTPASVDSIVSSNGQEDHVSMAANAATKMWRVIKNTERLLAIEFMTAAQALSFRRPKTTSDALEDVVKRYRTEVPVLESDRILQEDMVRTVAFMRTLDG